MPLAVRGLAVIRQRVVRERIPEREDLDRGVHGGRPVGPRHHTYDCFWVASVCGYKRAGWCGGCRHNRLRRHRGGVSVGSYIAGVRVGLQAASTSTLKPSMSRPSVWRRRWPRFRSAAVLAHALDTPSPSSSVAITLWSCGCDRTVFLLAASRRPVAWRGRSSRLSAPYPSLPSPLAAGSPRLGRVVGRLARDACSMPDFGEDSYAQHTQRGTQRHTQLPLQRGH